MVHDSWEQGQHVSIIAPTGGGKSVLACKGLLPMWEYTLTLDAKGEDPVLRSSGRKVRRFPNIAERYKHHRFWVALPPDQSQAAFESFRIFRQVFKQKGWTVYLDELRLFTDRMYLPAYHPWLPREVERLWLYGRSRGITLVTGTQAPRWIPAAAFEQPRHFFIGRVLDERAIKRLGEIGGDTDLIQAVVPTLDNFEFLYVGPTGMGISKYPLKKGG